MTPLEIVCNLPNAVQAGDISPQQLVGDSGIENELSSLAATSIAAILLTNLSLAEAWLRWSEDKRVSPGWFFLRENNGYFVGYSPDGPRFFFKDSVAACSEFIVREITAMLQTMRANSVPKGTPLNVM